MRSASMICLAVLALIAHASACDQAVASKCQTELTTGPKCVVTAPDYDFCACYKTYVGCVSEGDCWTSTLESACKNALNTNPTVKCKADDICTAAPTPKPEDTPKPAPEPEDAPKPEPPAACDTVALDKCKAEFKTGPICATTSTDYDACKCYKTYVGCLSEAKCYNSGLKFSCMKSFAKIVTDKCTADDACSDPAQPKPAPPSPPLPGSCDAATVNKCQTGFTTGPKCVTTSDDYNFCGCYRTYVGCLTGSNCWTEEIQKSCEKNFKDMEASGAKFDCNVDDICSSAGAAAPLFVLILALIAALITM